MIFTFHNVGKETLFVINMLHNVQKKNIVRDKNLSQCRERNIVSPIRNNRAFDFEGLK